MMALAETKDERLLVLSEINEILDRDLELLEKKERTLERWFSLLGKESTFDYTKERLINLKSQLMSLE